MTEAKLDAALLAILACPTCKGPLTQAADGSSLNCAACRRDYPVVNGIADLGP
jgi:uncharacterized protein